MRYSSGVETNPWGLWGLYNSSESAYEAQGLSFPVPHLIFQRYPLVIQHRYGSHGSFVDENDDLNGNVVIFLNLLKGSPNF